MRPGRLPRAAWRQRAHDATDVVAPAGAETEQRGDEAGRDGGALGRCVRERTGGGGDGTHVPQLLPLDVRILSAAHAATGKTACGPENARSDRMLLLVCSH